jgi:hypothetical protein
MALTETVAVIVDRGVPAGPGRLPLLCRLLSRSYVLAAYVPHSLGLAIIARGSDILGRPGWASAWRGRLIRERAVVGLAALAGVVG